MLSAPSSNDFAFNPLWWSFRDLALPERLAVFDDTLLHRQRFEAMDWHPILESLDEYQNRVWDELGLEVQS